MNKQSVKLEYNRVIMNIPVKLLKGFDESCKVQSFSRPEAIKYCMRAFVKNGGKLDD